MNTSSQIYKMHVRELCSALNVPGNGDSIESVNTLMQSLLHAVKLKESNAISTMRRAHMRHLVCIRKACMGVNALLGECIQSNLDDLASEKERAKFAADLLREEEEEREKHRKETKKGAAKDREEKNQVGVIGASQGRG